MQQINDFLIETLGPLGPLIAVGGLGLLLVIIALPAFLFRRADPMDRLKGMSDGEGGTDFGDAKALRVGGKDERLDRFAQFLEPQDQEEFSQIQLQLIRAGYRSKGAVQTLHFAQFLMKAN